MTESVFDRNLEIRNSTLPHGPKFLAVTLNLFIGHNPDAWPGQRALARAMSASLRSVQKWQSELVECGVLLVHSGANSGVTNRYRLNIAALPRSGNVEEPCAADARGSDQRCAPAAAPPRTSCTSPPHQMRTKTTGKIREETGVDVDIPESLQTPEFLEAWADFLADRKGRRKAVTPLAAKRLLAKCLSWGPDKAIRSIGSSIESGWTGLFDPDQSGRKQQRTGSTAAGDAWQQLCDALKRHSHYAPESVQTAVCALTWTIASEIGLSRIAEANSHQRDRLQAQFSKQFDRRNV